MQYQNLSVAPFEQYLLQGNSRTWWLKQVVGLCFGSSSLVMTKPRHRFGDLWLSSLAADKRSTVPWLECHTGALRNDPFTLAFSPHSLSLIGLPLLTPESSPFRPTLKAQPKGPTNSVSETRLSLSPARQKGLPHL